MNEEQNEQKLLLTRKQLAGELKVSIPTIDRWIKIRAVPFYKMGRKVLFDLQEVLKYRSGCGKMIKISPDSAPTSNAA